MTGAAVVTGTPVKPTESCLLSIFVLLQNMVQNKVEGAKYNTEHSNNVVSSRIQLSNVMIKYSSG